MYVCTYYIRTYVRKPAIHRMKTCNYNELFGSFDQDLHAGRI